MKVEHEEAPARSHSSEKTSIKQMSPHVAIASIDCKLCVKLVEAGPALGFPPARLRNPAEWKQTERLINRSRF